MRDEFAQRWPELDGIPWFPALGDGACNNVGSGCVSRDRFALMVGTSGAMRAVIEESDVEIPAGLWCYRVDRKRFVLGGALSNGGSVYAWMRSTLQLPSERRLEKQLAAMTAGRARADGAAAVRGRAIARDGGPTRARRSPA